MIELVDQFERKPGMWHPDVIKGPNNFEHQLAQLRQAIVHIPTDHFNVRVLITGDRLTGLKLSVTCSNPHMATQVKQKLSAVIQHDHTVTAEADQQELRERYNADRRVKSLQMQIDELDRPGLTHREQQKLAFLIRILNDLKMREYGDLK